MWGEVSGTGTGVAASFGPVECHLFLVHGV